MTIETLPTKFCPDFTSAQQVDFAVKENDFTSGFTLKDQDGINNIRDTWQVSYPMLSYSDMAELWTFLQTKKGYISFFWTPPRETATRRWTCIKMEREAESSNSWTVTAVFQEMFTHYADELSTFRIIGVAGIGHAGTVTDNLTFAPGTVGVSGIEVTGTAGYVWPSQVLQDWYQYDLVYGPNSMVLEGDYIYMWFGRQFISKIHANTMKTVAIFDLNAQTTSGPTDFGNDTDNSMWSDGTDLFIAVNQSSTCKIVRLSLSDLTTYTSVTLTGIDSHFFNVGVMFVYSGFLYCFFNPASTIQKAIRIDLSNFTTGGVTTLDWSSHVSAGTLSMCSRRGFVIADHYVFVTFQNDNRIMRLNLSGAFAWGDIVLQDLGSGPQPHGWRGRGAYDGTYVYFANHITGSVIRIPIANTSFATLTLPAPGEVVADTFAGTGLYLEGSQYLWTATADSFYGDNAAYRIDLNSSGTFANLTVVKLDIDAINLGDDEFGARHNDEHTWGAMPSVGFSDIVSDGTYLYACSHSENSGQIPNIPNVMRLQLNWANRGDYICPPQNIPPTFVGIVDSPWNGNDLAPSTTTTVIDDGGFTLFGDITGAGNRIYFVVVNIRFATAGVINSMTIGGNAANLITEKANGGIYTAIWEMHDPTVITPGDLHIIAHCSDAVLYWDWLVYSVDGFQDPSLSVVYVATPTSGTGTAATIAFPDMLADDICLGSVALANAFVERNYTLDNGFTDDNNDEWIDGGAPPYDQELSNIQFREDTPPQSAGTLTIDWSTDSVGSTDWAAVLINISGIAGVPEAIGRLRGTMGCGIAGNVRKAP